jgi:hypothetical protein
MKSTYPIKRHQRVPFDLFVVIDILIMSLLYDSFAMSERTASRIFKF